VSGDVPVIARFSQDTAEWRARAADLTWCLAWILLSRLALLVVGVSARLVAPEAVADAYVWTYADALWLDVWGVWDTGWYLDLARHGYDAAPDASGPTAGQANWAFFPLYPAFARGLHAATGMGLFPAMLAIANAAFAGAVALLFLETRALFGRPAARAAVALLCVVPGSYVFSSAYTESLFLLLILLALACARREAWLAAGLAGLAAALTRNLGVLVAVPVLILGWRHVRDAVTRFRPGTIFLGEVLRDARARRVLVALTLPVAGLFAVMAALWAIAGDPFAFVTIQAAWNRELGNPLASLAGPFAASTPWTVAATTNWLAAVVALGLVAVVAWNGRLAVAAFGALLVLVPLAAGLQALLRYTMVVVPAFMGAGVLLARRPGALALVLAPLATVNGFLMACWALGLPNVM
jgi:hypothetical protein